MESSKPTDEVAGDGKLSYRKIWFKLVWIALVLPAGLAGVAQSQAPQKALIEVWADKPTKPVSRLLTGACIEDVNHEIYGGLYSQMIFGESFQEPPALPNQLQGFRVLGGRWQVKQGELSVTGSPGDKIVSEFPAFRDGEVGVEVYVPDRKLTNAGLIVRVNSAERGADNFDGYEIALNASEQKVLLGRHRQDFTLLKTAPCAVPTGQWVPLSAKLNGSAIDVLVKGKSVLRHDDGDSALPAGTIGLRQWQRDARYRNLWIKTGDKTQPLPFEPSSNQPLEVSGMWRPVQTGNAKGTFALVKDHPFVGRQLQQITFAEGQGQVGIENQGLNRWGMQFIEGKDYQGVVWARAAKPVNLLVALENQNGSQRWAEKLLSVKNGDWQLLTFSLTPTASGLGRLAITLPEPGSVDLGYAFLQPREWGRFKGLPVRRDVAQGMIDQGLTMLRYGGSMVNHREYRWTKMIGPRERRPPYAGTWYPYSSNGWGIPDFMAFCEAAGFEYIPAFCMDESAQDMVDFIRYAKDTSDTEWGKRRTTDGHPQPFQLHYVELGNEERVDENYFKKFKALAEAIWERDPNVILVVGDFAYSEPIRDPFKLRGSAAGITSLAVHQQILKLAKEHGREVWFDVHIGTEGPRPDNTLAGTFSYIDALEKVADGARFKVAVFELNAGNHSMRRALANAMAIQAIERDGRIAVVCSANALQPDGQNDNGWNQGLLFLNPGKVWLQPPGYVTQLFSRHYQPEVVQCQVTGIKDTLDASAKRSQDGNKLVLQAVNPTDRAISADIRLVGYIPASDKAQVTELSGPLTARNTATQTNSIVPIDREWQHGLRNGQASYTFPPYSITFIRWQ
jgi:hypothetical protein